MRQTKMEDGAMFTVCCTSSSNQVALVLEDLKVYLTSALFSESVFQPKFVHLT